MTEYEQNNVQPETSGPAPVPADPIPQESPEEISAASSPEGPGVTPEIPVVPTPEIPQAPAVEIPVQDVPPVMAEAADASATNQNVGIPVPHLTLEGIPMEEVPQAPVSTESWNIPQPPTPPHAPDPQEAIHAAQAQFNPSPAPNPYAQANAQQEAPPYTAPPQYSYGTPPPPPQPYGNMPPQYQEGQYQQQGYYPPQPAQPTHYNVPPMGYQQKSRLAAGLLGIMFGTFGVHNFYLGFQTKAIIQLVVALAGGLITCGVATVAMAIWGLIEGIQILSSHPSKLYDGSNVILRD